MRKNNYKRNIGTVSHGTMREEDLIPRFLSELRSMKPLKREHTKFARGIEAQIDKDGYYEGNDSTDDLAGLYVALNDYALPGMYFGSHLGDGSDYGYWLSESFVDDFEGLKVNDTRDVPKGYSGEVLHVNDHGNMTLYAASRGRLREVWGLV